MGRTLYWVPVLHSGSELIPYEGTDQLIIDETESYLKFVEQYWSRLEPEIWKRKVDRVYVDGWTGGSWDGVVTNARAGGRVYNIVLNMIMNDVVLEQTEELPLVDNMFDELLNAKKQKSKDNSLLSIASLMLVRDLFIRRNIRATLHDGENGMLFIGLAHPMIDYKDIKVEEVYPANRLISEMKETGKRWSIVPPNVRKRQERLFKELKKGGFLQHMEDYVEHPEKYGFDYNI